ncbi:MAG: hypothetical protein Kow0068_25480 [Marinilabiliales bacterium]
MKKVLGIVLFLGIIAVFTSCKKDWTCECTLTDSATNTTTTTTYTINDATKSDAQTSCDAYELSAGSVTYACELK